MTVTDTRPDVAAPPAEPAVHYRLRNPWRWPLNLSAAVAVLSFIGACGAALTGQVRIGWSVGAVLAAAGLFVCVSGAHTRYAHRPPSGATFTRAGAR